MAIIYWIAGLWLASAIGVTAWLLFGKFTHYDELFGDAREEISDDEII